MQRPQRKIFHDPEVGNNVGMQPFKTGHPSRLLEELKKANRYWNFSGDVAGVCGADIAYLLGIRLYD
ncbi:MAG: hypothetical protein WC831_03245 [Parcubacteria group bacterium]|jgi:hypothetical protein